MIKNLNPRVKVLLQFVLVLLSVFALMLFADTPTGALTVGAVSLLAVAFAAGKIRVKTGVQCLLLLLALTVMPPSHGESCLLFLGLGLAMTEEEFRSSISEGVTSIKTLTTSIEGRLKTLEDTSTKSKADLEQELKTLQVEFLQMRKLQLAIKTGAGMRRPGQVSEECARFLGAVYLKAAFDQGRLDGDKVEKAAGVYKEITGVEMRAALTSSDIPLPVGYSAEVVELVSTFGAARKYGTVFPLGAANFKLPRLGTDPTFGLIGASATVTEKSPTVMFVTFAPEKFGGLVRLPSEIDEDSIVAMGQFVSRWAARGIAQVEDWNFFRSTGAGSGQNGTAPGLLTSCVTDSKTVVLATGSTAPNQATLAKIRAMRAVVDAAALGTSGYFFHPSWEQFFSGLNTAGDKPYLANGIMGASLDGFPIHWVDTMPVYSVAASVSTAFGLFGDASYEYLGVRRGIAIDTSKEAGFTTDEILIRALERFTVGKMALGCACAIVTAAS